MTDAEPWQLPTLVTTLSGLVHVDGCTVLRPVHTTFPWRPEDDGPGVARACRRCLPNGLPS